MSPVPTRAQTFEHHGTTLHFWETGPADAPLVVFTHGAATHHGIFDAAARALAPRYRVITWDLPGHGDSQPFARPLTMERMADDLAALLRAAGAESAHLVGQSMGGDVVQEFVHRFPERVRSAVVVGCLPLIRPRPFRERLSAWVFAQKLRVLPLARFRRGVAQAVSRQDAVKNLVEEAMARIPRGTLVAIWSAIARAPRDEPGYRFPCPVLAVVGDEDHLGGGIIQAAAESWPLRDPNVARAVIPGAGHMTHLDDPEAFHAALEAFLDRGHPPAGA